MTVITFLNATFDRIRRKDARNFSFSVFFFFFFFAAYTLSNETTERAEQELPRVTQRVDCVIRDCKSWANEVNKRCNVKFSRVQRARSEIKLKWKTAPSMKWACYFSPVQRARATLTRSRASANQREAKKVVRIENLPPRFKQIDKSFDRANRPVSLPQ